MIKKNICQFFLAEHADVNTEFSKSSICGSKNGKWSIALQCTNQVCCNYSLNQGVEFIRIAGNSGFNDINSFNRILNDRIFIF